MLLKDVSAFIILLTVTYEKHYYKKTINDYYHL